MADIDVVPAGIATALGSVARDLHTEFAGVFGEPTIERLLIDSYRELAANATVTRWLIIGTEQFARQRLQAMTHAEARPDGRAPAVLFLCVHNAGRSQMALGLFHSRAQGRALAWSGGSEPAALINPAVVSAMAEIDIDITVEFPKPWTEEFLAAADVVVTMGCGDSCPLVPGTHYEDWDLEDPTGKSVEEIRPIRDELVRRVDHLLAELGVISV
ncbi:MAG TPA: arsenate reductase ArsC [Mycobacteriales bacterium]|nr:arsenate reductase ArsC [Mycobacteriales bacterium]